MTALHLAAEGGHIKIVTHLCDKGADLSIQDNHGVNLNAGTLAIEFELASFQGKCSITV